MAVEKPLASSESTLSRFRRIVLGWDYLRLLRDSAKRKQSSKDAAVARLKRVKSTYRDVEEYLSVYEPLLLEEVKAQIVQQKDEEEVSGWSKGAVVTCEESGEFHSVTLVVDDTFPEVSENDLLLLSKDKFEEGSAPDTYAFAMVEFQGGNQTLKALAFLGGEIVYTDKDEVQSSPRLLRMLPIIMRKENIFYILKVCSLSTIMREFTALHSLGSLPFKNLILFASNKFDDCASEDRVWNVPRPLMEFLESTHNESQLQAIRVGLSRRPFVLVQGPPGTGKTQTILGLLSSILHSAPARVQKGLATVKHRAELPLEEKYCHWSKASPWLSGINPRDLIMPMDGDDGFFPESGNELKPEVLNTNRKYRIHVLVCAPSNSALDEIVLRVLRSGIHDESDHVYNPKIVRVGLKAHHSVQAVSMDYIVEQKLSSVDRSSGKGSASGPMDRDRIRASILDESAIVFSTLSFSGSSLFSRMNRIFDVVIIDEAAQAVEPATLIPLAHGCRQVYLVGDPAQLPATVISTTAENFGYKTSLFERFQRAGYPVQLLKTQYRMHPEIRSFPSREFYADSLVDGESVPKLSERPWHEYRCFGPFSFFDIDGVESRSSASGSWMNADEIEFILLIYQHLVKQYPQLKSGSQVAVISPYAQQVSLLRDRFKESFGQRSDQFVDVNTVDGFQGREKDIAIFSCVRANSGKGIGFLSDARRMNVGITRARASVLVVGSASTLMQDDRWKNLVNNAMERGCYIKVSKPYSSFFAEANLKSLQRVKQKRVRFEEMHAKLDEMGSTQMMDAAFSGADDGRAEEDIDMDDFGGGGGRDDD